MTKKYASSESHYSGDLFADTMGLPSQCVWLPASVLERHRPQIPCRILSGFRSEAAPRDIAVRSVEFDADESTALKLRRKQC
jgi:hypothetical protein